MNTYKRLFPIFDHQADLVYLDNAATTQRHMEVIKVTKQFYESENASVGRGLYPLALQATEKYEASRKNVAHFIGASNAECIAFTQGATAAINTVAFGLVEPDLKKGENIVVTIMEHHANLIPWQIICKNKGAELRIVPINKLGQLDLNALINSIDQNTKLVGCTLASNVLGTLNPIDEITAIAHQKGASVLIDAAQGMVTNKLNVHSKDYDFLVFSAHKIFGPMGIGCLYAHPKHHEKFKPLIYGGGIVKECSETEAILMEYPYLLESGTPNVAAVIGMNTAIDFISQIDQKSVKTNLSDLSNYCVEQLQMIPDIAFTAAVSPKREPILSFHVNGIHAHDVATFLAREQICVRAGYHCAEPLFRHLKQESSVRVSLSIYNEKRDIDHLNATLKSLIKFWK